MPAERPFIVGLTGSIGMGKTETARMFARLGVPVYDADAAVHGLYEPGGAAVPKIAEAFPDCVSDGKVDRAKLGAHVTANPQAFETLEAIVHPLVGHSQRDFLDKAAKDGAEMVVLDIPLLFETGGDARMDAIVVVSAPHHVQRARVLARAGMKEEKLDGILAKQTPDAEKRAKADFVVETDQGLDHAFDQVKNVVAALHHKRLGKHAKDA
jgi:dephospho-CoA kinase